MIEKIKVITDREKASIIYSFFTGITDRITLYLIAKDYSGNNKETLYNYSSKWYNQKHIQQYITEVKKKFEIIIQNELKKIQGENTFEYTGVNFSNPAEFLEYANNKANNITDEKQRLDYLKMISDLLRFKDQGKNETDIQRFYTPLACQNCKIYQDQAQKEPEK